MIEAGGDNMAMGCYGNKQQTSNYPQNRHFMHPRLMLVCMYVASFPGTWNKSTLHWDAGIVVRICIIPSNKRASYNIAVNCMREHKGYNPASRALCGEGEIGQNTRGNTVSNKTASSELHEKAQGLQHVS